MQTSSQPARLRRKESFLGLHFDFHAREESTAVGKDVTPAMVEHIIEMVQPDFVQCDCKGHQGYASYPTNVGYRALGIVKDTLEIWREVTARRGVALFMHYSGILDEMAVKHHPDWAHVDEQGKVDPHRTSVFGPYVDELMIPQLKELNDVYGVDGVWVDGDNWASKNDYRAETIAAFQAQTGIQEIPYAPTDPYYYEFTQFCREGFRQYLRHYVDELHKHNPDFQICSNWSFSSKMPEPVSAGVDFLSGDFWLQNSVNGARLEARCLRHQGLPWDLMTWSFSGQHTHDNEEDFSTKSVPQLQREAAVVLALSGGFQLYFQQDRNGAIFPWQMEVAREVAQFCRARQEICHRAEAIPQIALYYASSTFYRQETAEHFEAHDGTLKPLQGVLQVLLDNQYSTDVLMEHQIKGHMADYPLIVIPEWNRLEQDQIEELLAYVHNGGNLLLVGPQTASLFADALQVELTEATQEQQVIYLEHAGRLARLKAANAQVQLKESAQAFGRWYPSNNTTLPSSHAASITAYGQGKIAATYFNVGQRYLESTTTVVRDFMHALVNELFPEPLATVTGSHLVDVTLNRSHGKIAINLVNMAGPHADDKVHVFDEIPVVGPLTITIRCEEQPQRIMSQPSGTELPLTWSEGKATLTLPCLEIHEVIIIE